MNAVKKSIALLLSVCLLVGCVACSDGKSKDKDAKKETTATSTTTTAVQNNDSSNDNTQNNEQPTQTQTPSQTTPGITYADISGYWGTSVNVGKLIESAVTDNLSEVDPAIAEVYRAAFQRIDPNLFVVDWVWNWRYQDAFIEMSYLYIEYDKADFEAKQTTYVTEFNKVLGACAAEQGFDYDLEEQLQDVTDLIDDFMLYEFPQDFRCSPEFYCYNGKVYVTDLIEDLSELTDAMLADVTLSGNTMTVRSIPNADFEELLPLTFQRIG
ncbi:MAG: hypothetical protein IJB36_01925 [Clostridia bacterium]|nr:hypothetical protein [Clostridia bacterium]